MIPAIAYVLIVAHFVADFIAQTDWMALHKSKRWDALALHVAVYTAVLQVFTVPFAEGGHAIVDPRWMTFALVNCAAHFVQDAITSRITSRLWFLKWTPAVKGWRVLEPATAALGGVSREETAYWLDDLGTRHWFFVMIGFDQLLHYITLFVTAGWWLR